MTESIAVVIEINGRLSRGGRKMGCDVWLWFLCVPFSRLLGTNRFWARDVPRDNAVL